MTKEIKFAVILIIIFIAGCNSKRIERESFNDSTAIQKNETSLNNQLTQQQQDEGWKLLFNGRDTEGLRFYQHKENNSWEVIDGTLHSKPFDSANVRSDIMTVDQYENFDLRFEWKLSPQGNSGVMYRVTEEFKEPYQSGPEYQILDDEGWPGELKSVHSTASSYDMYPAPADKPMKPIGEWNMSRIVVNGNQVEHWLNGALMIKYEIASAEWQKLKNASKWSDAKGYGASKSGYIVFQDHGGEVWYKNIMIKPL